MTLLLEGMFLLETSFKILVHFVKTKTNHPKLYFPPPSQYFEDVSRMVMLVTSFILVYQGLFF